MSERAEPRRVVRPEVEGGVWANRIDVVWSPDELTLDCWRVDHSSGTPPVRMILVARVACFEAVVAKLLDDLPSAWARHSSGIVPPE